MSQDITAHGDFSFDNDWVEGVGVRLRFPLCGLRS